MRAPDDWERSRNEGQHLTDAEIEIVRDGFRNGRTPRDVARDLKCTTRVIQHRYRTLRGERLSRKVVRPVAAPNMPTETKSRFYKSNFEL